MSGFIRHHKRKKIKGEEHIRQQTSNTTSLKRKMLNVERGKICRKFRHRKR